MATRLTLLGPTRADPSRRIVGHGLDQSTAGVATKAVEWEKKRKALGTRAVLRGPVARRARVQELKPPIKTGRIAPHTAPGKVVGPARGSKDRKG